MDRIEKAKAIKALLNEACEEWHLEEKNVMYTALRERFGPDADEVIKQAIGARIQRIWAKIAGILGSDTLEDFTKILFDPLPELGWEFTKEKNEKKISYRVTKCPKVEMAKKLGAEKLMFLIACETDCFSAKGFNEKIKFSRTKTLMEGYDCCDHTYEFYE